MDTKLAASLDELQELFGARMQEYEAKLNLATTSATPATPDIASIAREFTEFKAFVCQALTSLKAQVQLLAAGYDRHETVMRRKVLLFHGVPEQNNENLNDVVMNILTDKIKLTEVDGKMNILHVCHRLGFSQQKARPILVRFFRMEHRQLVWDSKKALKGTGFTISEFLTQARHRLFTAARKHFGMRNSWSMEGKIIILCPDKSRRRIETASDLQYLMSKFPSTAADTEDSVHSEEPGSPSAVVLATPARRSRKARLRK